MGRSTKLSDDTGQLGKFVWLCTPEIVCDGRVFQPFQKACHERYDWLHDWISSNQSTLLVMLVVRLVRQSAKGAAQAKDLSWVELRVKWIRNFETRIAVFV